MALPPGYPQVTPMLSYEDAATACDWLVKAFGFTERMRIADDNGVVGHAELALEDGGLVMLAPTDTRLTLATSIGRLSA